jgi:hypothetical protein
MKVRYIISEKWSSDILHEVIDAVEWGIQYLKIRDPKSTLTVKLITGNEEPLDGTADRIKNRRYEIRIKYAEDYLASLFHELVHIKQFIHDGLRFYPKAARWKGEKVHNPDYLESPWEMEARAMEDVLIYRFREVN